MPQKFTDSGSQAVGSPKVAFYTPSTTPAKTSNHTYSVRKDMSKLTMMEDNSDARSGSQA
jgi:hypothetical protein